MIAWMMVGEKRHPLVQGAMTAIRAGQEAMADRQAVTSEELID
jgi:hypothetical protein